MATTVPTPYEPEAVTIAFMEVTAKTSSMVRTEMTVSMAMEAMIYSTVETATTSSMAAAGAIPLSSLADTTASISTPLAGKTPVMAETV